MVEVIRKNSTARHHVNGSGAAPTPVLPPVAEQLPAHTMSPHMQQGLGVPPSPEPQAPSHRQFANQHRYTLVDPGSNSAGGASPPLKTDSPSYARPAGRPPVQRAGSVPSPVTAQGGPQDVDINGPQQPPPARSSGKGPTTFAEMGIQGVKLEEKECVIM